MSSTITVDGVTYGENMVRHLQQQVNDCRERGFIDDAGNVRKVLGILALTKDGCVVVSSKWSLWHPDAGEGKGGGMSRFRRARNRLSRIWCLVVGHRWHDTPWGDQCRRCAAWMNP